MRQAGSNPSESQHLLSQPLQPLREVVKPPGQLQLNEKELAEEVGRTLTAANPSAPANVVRYSYRERGYRPEPLIDQLLHHFSMDGCLIHQESEEVLKDRQRREAAAFAAVSRRVTAQSRRVTAQSRRTTHSQLELPGGVPIAAVVAAPAWESPLAAEHSMLGLPPGLDDEGASATVSAKQLRNQFNFTDRGAMTTHGLQRTHSTMTEAPPTATASGSCTCWEIFDAFIDDQERQRQQEEAAKLKAAAARRGSVMAGAAALASRRSAGGAAAEGQGREAEVQAAADGPVVARVVERMMQQNVFKDVVMDFKVGTSWGMARSQAVGPHWRGCSQLRPHGLASQPAGHLQTVPCAAPAITQQTLLSHVTCTTPRVP